MTLPPLMTVAEVAEYLRCDPSTVREMIREGHLSAFKLRSHYRVDSSHLFAGTHAENTRDCIRKGRWAHHRPNFDARGARNANTTLSDDDVVAIRVAVASGESHGDVATRFALDRSQIGRIARGDSWPHVGGPRTRRRRVGITAGITGGAS